VRISVRELTRAKQTPWEASSLVNTFYFAPATKPNAISPRTRDFVVNGSFENEYYGWGTGHNENRIPRLLSKGVFWSIRNVDITGEFDSGVAKSGLKSFKIVNKTPMSPHAYRTMSQRITGLKPDTRYRISFWIKALGAGASTLKIITDSTWDSGRGIDAGTYDWREHVLNLRTKAGESFTDLRILSEEPGTVWIDDIELREISITALTSPGLELD
jgi:hypothetical protein